MALIEDLPTPCLVLEQPRLDSNIERMRQQMAALDVRLRPHMKTAKSIDVARLALDLPGQGITVSTLSEAEYFFAHGITDIMYAVAIAPAKLERVAALRRLGADLQIVLDTLGVAEVVAAHGDHKVWIEIDCDGLRSGVPADDPSLTAIAETLGDRLAGVMTHAGGSYGCRSAEELAAFAERERAGVTDAANRIRTAGLKCAGVSVGSTPTMSVTTDLTGVTEARPGVYMFMDLYQAGLGVCGVEDVALSVLATVIGHRADGVVIDAGALALSLDRSTATQPIDMGFGLVCDLDCRPFGDVVVGRVTQEHGVVAGRANPPPDLPIGTKVRILPNHACITAAAHPRYAVVVAGDVVDSWERLQGW